MSTKKINWFKVADTVGELGWQSNSMVVIEVDGKKITVAQYHDQLFAVAYKCPHASGIMADGSIDAAGNIICPLHRYKFNLQNGRNTSGEGYYLKTYPVEVREDGVFVGMEEKGFFNWL
jgi:3-phenylpropionate/trans-cinnamate dioxygenase ferredoxin subunit